MCLKLVVSSLEHVSVRTHMTTNCHAAVTGLSEHIAETKRVFGLKLDDTDRAAIKTVIDQSKMLPGDCGDEYRG